MSTRKRHFIYSNDVTGKDNGWKVIDADEKENKIQIAKKIQNCYKNENSNCHKSIKNDKCNQSYVCTLVSVKNPDTILVIPQILTAAPVVGESVDLVQWTDIVPDALNSFDNITGTVIVPETGDYDINAVISYKTSVSIPVDISLDDVPYLEIYDVDTDAVILTASFPTTSIVVPVPSMSTGEPPIDVPVAYINGTGQIIFSAVVPLIAGQRLRIRAVTNGLVYVPSFSPLQEAVLNAFIDFSPERSTTTLTIRKYRNSPTVTITCNN